VRQMRCTELALMSTALALIVAFQWFASTGGSVRASAMPRATIFDHRNATLTAVATGALTADEAMTRCEVSQR
jgi:hypothetical protein